MSRYVIDRNALVANIKAVVEKAGVPVIGVVKANGYGLGMVDLARVLVEQGIGTLAITEVTDIAPLRTAFSPDVDILVMRSTCLPAELELIVAGGCIATVGSPEAAKALDAAAAAAGATARCHIKVDTGFGRYGFLPSQAEQVKECFALANIQVCGMYTHFSAAYGDDAATSRQLAALKQTAAAVKEAGLNPGTVHAANSPALYNYPEATLDAVRIGSAFLGRLITKQPHGLNRIGFMEADVLETRRLPAGSALGYGGAVSLSRATTIAHIAAGHLDGFGIEVVRPNSFRRALSALKHANDKQALTVQIDGQEYSVLGETDLQRATVDVTGSAVKPGDVARIDLNPLLVSPAVERVWR